MRLSAKAVNSCVVIGREDEARTSKHEGASCFARTTVAAAGQYLLGRDMPLCSTAARLQPPA